jgi:hypothetical protein
MVKTQFQVEFNWVIDVLTSCVTLDQISVADNLFNKLMVKWGGNLDDSRIYTIGVLFNKIKKFQTNKIKKNRSQNNRSVDFLK